MALILEPNTPQFFFDGSWIAAQRRLVRRWQPAKIYPEPLFRADKPWEGRILALYGTVLPLSGGGYRMYYSDLPIPKGHHGEYSKVFVAESADGFRWEKPELGLVDWRGSRANNIAVSPGHPLDAPSIVHDPESEHPYKLIVYEREKETSGTEGLYAYTSSDGLSFEKIAGRRLLAGDRTNSMTRKVDGGYVVYTRHRDMMKLTGARSIYRTVSPDFMEWSEPRLVLKPDLVDEPNVEYYGMSVFPWRDWFIGLLEYWRSEIDCIETYLVFSRDGVNWRHPEPRQPFIASTYPWNRTWSSCASNGPVIMNEQMVFYFGGRWVSHHFDFAQQDGVIGFASLPLDRFCALEAQANGLLETMPFKWPGGDLVVNADTRPSFSSHPSHTTGTLKVGVLDGSAEALPDWSGENRAVYSGNTHSRGQLTEGLIRWPGDRSLDKLRGKKVRLRFGLDYGRLYSFQSRE